MNAMPSFVSAASAAACAAPVCTSAVAGSERLRAPRRPARRRDPVLRRDRDRVEADPSGSRACAVGTSKTAIVAPPIESTEPNFAIPVISYRLTAPSAATPIVSPTAKPWSLAVFASITTSSAPCAQLPFGERSAG